MVSVLLSCWFNFMQLSVISLTLTFFIISSNAWCLFGEHNCSPTFIFFARSLCLLKYSSLHSFSHSLFHLHMKREQQACVCVCVRPVCRMTCFVGRSDIVHVVAITARPDCEQTQSYGGTRQGVLCSTVTWVWACLASSVSQLSVHSFRTRRLRLCFLHRCGLRPCRLFVCSAGVSAPNCLTSLTNPS